VGYSAAKMRLYHSNALLAACRSVLVRRRRSVPRPRSPESDKKNLKLRRSTPAVPFNAAGARATGAYDPESRPTSSTSARHFGIDVLLERRES